MTSASEVLAENGIRLRTASTGNHKTTRPSCSFRRTKRTDPCLSVTIEPDGKVLWNCHHCGWSGAGGGEGYRPRIERRTYRKPVRPTAPHRPDTLLSYFANRGISAAVVERMGIHKTKHWFPQVSAEIEAIAFPYEWNGELRNVKYRGPNKVFVQEKDPEPVLYNADCITADEDLVITEGEIDVLSFLEADVERVVSLPNGAPQTADEPSDRRYEPLGTHWDALLRVKRFLIATDMDEKGNFLANELARRLGKDRCWRVKMPISGDVEIKDANECLVQCGAQTLVERVAMAEPWPIEGLHDVEEYAVDVMDLYEGKGPQPLSTGFDEIDKAFRYYRGQFIALTGVPNHGKSRWLDQVAIQTARLRDEKWAFFSPETGESNHLADLCEIWAGAPFFEGPHQRMSAEDVNIALAWLNERVYLLGAIEHTPSIDWLLERARAAVLRYGVSNIVLDPYNEIEASRPDNLTETEFVSQLISKCKRFAKHHDCTVWMVIHPTKLKPGDEGKDPVPSLYDLAGSAHWRNKADAGLVVYRDYDKAVSYLIAKKIRRQPMCGRLGSVRLSFDGVSRRFADIPSSYQPLGKEKF
jgi:twinkle protein